MRIPVRTIVIVAALAALPATAPAQSWPSRHVTIVVAFPAGGPTDVLARAIASDLADKLGQQFVVENRSGAGGNVGAASVARAAGDGATFLFATTSVVNNRFMYRNITFDTDRDFAPVVLISKTPIVLVASQATGLKNLAALIARAKADPGKLNLGTPGHGTAAHITAESLQRLSTLAEAVVDVALRDALRRKAGEFLAQQAPRLDSAGLRDELRPLARAAGLDL